jgi:hypothetical protein
MENIEKKSLVDLVQEISHEYLEEPGKVTEILGMTRAENDSTPLSVEAYKAIGALTYLIGKDFTSSPYPTEKVLTRWRERFNGINKQVFDNVLSYIMTGVITDTRLRDAKESMHCQLDKTWVITPVIMNELRRHVATIFRDSELASNYAVPVKEIMQLKEYTYSDILKINSLFMNNIEFKSNAMKSYIKLYSAKDWTDALNKGVKLADERKLSVLLQDAILTFQYHVTRYQEFYKITGVGEIINNMFDIVFDANLPLDELNVLEGKLKELYDVHVSSNPEPVVMKVNKEDSITEKIDSSREDNPSGFIYLTIADANDLSTGELNTPECLRSALGNLLGDAAYTSNLYEYVVRNTNSNKFGDIKSISGNMNMDDFKETLNNIMEERKKIYQDNIKFICNKIDPAIENRLKTLLTSVITDAITSTPEQKSVIASYLTGMQVQTYLHVHQLIAVIENCRTSNYQSYAALYDYLNTNDTMKRVSEIAVESNNMSTGISLISAILKFIEKAEAPVVVEDVAITNE